MSRPEAFASLGVQKRAITERVTAALRAIDGVHSITFVGSFVDRDDLSGISDVDTVVIVDHLTPARFDAAVAAVSALTWEDVGFPDRRPHVNATLGPLKFDAPDQIVIHLMLYDFQSHREHVLKSPFTCFDWERSPHSWGTPLCDLYPVGRLQPGDFLAARRGLSNYTRDLESGTLSFRRFEPRGDRMAEVADSVPLDPRHVGEYAYHIVRNLIVNTLKMRTGCNQFWCEEALIDDWQQQLPQLTAWLPFYQQLRDTKLTRGADFPANTIHAVRDFLQAFSAALEREIAAAFTVRLVRHARTELNDGTFLGSRRDPTLAAVPGPDAETWDAVYASPLRRAVDTAAALSPGTHVRIDPRLTEIDYGLVEGLTAAVARDRFASLRDAWDSGVDVAFPEGENTQQVLARAREFLDSLAGEQGRALVVTHNVVLRAILADLLGLDLRRSFRIPIEHLEPLDICRIGGRWVPNLDADIKARILDGYTGWDRA